MNRYWIGVLLAPFLLLCGEDSPTGGSGTTPKELYQELSTTEFREKPIGSSELSVLLSNLSNEFAGKLESTQKSGIDGLAAGKLVSAKRLADTLYPADAVDTLVVAGLEALLQGGLSTAMYCYLLALELEESADVLSKIGFGLNYLERYGEARVVLLRARELDSTYTAVRINLAYAYRKLGSLERAAFELRQAVRLQSDNAQFKIMLAKVYIQMGQNDLAYRALRQAQIQDNDNTEIQSLLATLDEPTDDTPTPVPMDPLDPAGNTTIIIDTVLAYKEIIDSALVRVGAYIGLGGVSWNIEQDFLSALAASDYQCSDCINGCSGNLDVCMASCIQAQCERDMVSLDIAVRAERKVPPEVDNILSGALAEYERATFSVVYRNKDAFDKAYATAVIYNTIETVEELVESTYVYSQQDMALWAEDVQITCTEAAQAWDEVDWEAYFASLNDGLTIDGCILFVCINLNGSQITVGVSVGIIQTEIMADMKTGDFGLGLGVGVNIGPAQAGAMFKVSTTGAQVTTDVSTRGPFRVKAGVTYDVINW